MPIVDERPGKSVGTSLDAPYLFLPGLPLTAESYREVRPHAPDTASLYFVDYGGFGRAQDGELLSVDATLDELRAVLERLGPETTIVGNSYGSYLAVHLAAAGARIKRLVLFTAFACLSEPEVEARKRLGQLLQEHPNATEAIAAQVAAMFVPSHAKVQATVLEQLKRMKHAAWLHAVALIVDVGRESRQLSSFATQGLIIQGTSDQTIPAHHAETVSSFGANLGIRWVDTDSHLLPLTTPEVAAGFIFTQEPCSVVAR